MKFFKLLDAGVANDVGICDNEDSEKAFVVHSAPRSQSNIDVFECPKLCVSLCWIL